MKRLGDYHWDNQTTAIWDGEAVANYETALEQCENHRITELKADIHWRIAAVKLEVAEKELKSQPVKRKYLEELFKEADKHVKMSISLDKSSSKVSSTNL